MATHMPGAGEYLRSMLRNEDEIERLRSLLFEQHDEVQMLRRALAEYESDSRIAARYASLRLSVRA